MTEKPIETVWPSEALEREMLADAAWCRDYNSAYVADAGHHIPALLERIQELEAALKAVHHAVNNAIQAALQDALKKE